MLHWPFTELISIRQLENKKMHMHIHCILSVSDIFSSLIWWNNTVDQPAEPHHLWRSAFGRPYAPLRVFLVSPQPQLSLLPNVVGNHILLRSRIEILSICRKFSSPPTARFTMQVLASFTWDVLLMLTQVHLNTVFNQFRYNAFLSFASLKTNGWMDVLYLHSRISVLLTCWHVVWYGGKYWGNYLQGIAEHREKHKSAL